MSRVKRSLPIVETAKVWDQRRGAHSSRKSTCTSWVIYQGSPRGETGPPALHEPPLHPSLSLSLCPLREHPPYRMRSLFEWLLVSRNILNAWPASSFSPLLALHGPSSAPSLSELWSLIISIGGEEEIVDLNFEALANIISCILHTSWGRWLRYAC